MLHPTRLLSVVGRIILRVLEVCVVWILVIVRIRRISFAWAWWGREFVGLWIEATVAVRIVVVLVRPRSWRAVPFWWWSSVGSVLLVLYNDVSIMECLLL